MREKIVLSTISWVLKNDHMTSTVSVRILFGPLRNVLRGLSHSILREKVGPNIFFHLKEALFSKNFVFNNISALKKMIL